jgi:type II restriction enzyme
MRNLTASDLVSAINQLPKNKAYHYIHPGTTGLISIERVQLPDGPIFIKRFNPSTSKTLKDTREVSMSVQMIWRVANAFREGQPINIDRILGASYNTRSILESLIAHTPEFYYCYPGRIEDIEGTTNIEHGHKHIIWLPNEPHRAGILQETKTDIVISEIPNREILYDALVLPDEIVQEGIDIDVQRRHAQMQIALIMIGLELNFRTWIAQNDKGILYKNKKIGEYEGVIVRLDNEKLVSAFPDAIKAALLIDVIWFQNSKLMPAIIEVEHSTGITSGLTRMKGLYDLLPQFRTRYAIVAPDQDKEKVKILANREQFKSLNARFFPYSAVEELYSLCQRRKLRGVSDEFLDTFMEPVVQGSGSTSYG